MLDRHGEGASLRRRASGRAAPLAHRQLRDGVRDALPLWLALVPIGLAFGYAAHSVHLSWWLAALMSALVYSSPSQFLALTLIAIGAGTPAIVATTFVSNLRYMLFGASLAPLLRDAPLPTLLPNAHGLGDGTLLGNRYLPPGTGSALAIVGAALAGGLIRWRREERSS